MAAVHSVIRIGRNNTNTDSQIPTLLHLCKQLVADLLVNTILHKTEQVPLLSPAMIRIKSQFLQLPSTVRETIYWKLFYATKVSYYDSRKYFNGQKYFELWWLFLDEKVTRELPLDDYFFYDGNFNLQLITYLSQHKTALKSLNLSYNFLLKQDYTKLAETQEQITQLSLNGPIHDPFLDVLRDRLALTSLTFSENATFKRTTIKKLDEFFSAKSKNLTEFSWRTSEEELSLTGLWADPAGVQAAIFRLQNLTKLHVHGHWMENLADTKVLRHLKQMTLYFGKAQYLSFLTRKNFPALEMFTADSISVEEEDRLEILSEFCLEFPDVEVRLNVATNSVPLNSILNHCPKVTSLSLVNNWKTTLDFPDLATNPFQRLVEISYFLISCKLPYKDFKLLWSSFPSLTKLSLKVQTVEDLDQDDFRTHLSRHKSVLKNLKSVFIQVLNNDFCGSSMMAILRLCPNLKEFGDLRFCDVQGQFKNELSNFASTHGAKILTTKHLYLYKHWNSWGLHFEYDQ